MVSCRIARSGSIWARARQLSFCTAVVAVWICGVTAHAQEQHEDAKLVPSNAAPGDLYGSSVSATGEFVVIGAPGKECPGGLNCGAAMIYRRNGSVWDQESGPFASDQAELDGFASSVTISAGLVVAGAPNDDCAGGGVNCGAAYVYRMIGGGSWPQEAKVVPSNADADDLFGAVSVNGNTFALGASGRQCAVAPNGPNCGAVMIFRFDGTMWQEEPVMLPADPEPGDRFGFSVALSGDVLIVGTPGDACNGLNSNCGAGYVFRHVGGGSWLQEAKLVPSNVAPGDQFGWSVAADGNTVVLGATGKECPAGNNCGAVMIFRYNGSVWNQEAGPLPADLAAGDQFGYSVALSGDSLVVGVPGADGPPAVNSGAAYVFRHVGGGSWIQEAKLTASDKATSDNFGWSVSISGNTVVAGARRDDTVAGADSGSAYVFGLCSPPNCNGNGVCISGSCVCNVGFVGAGCEFCAPNYYNYPLCTFCQSAITCSGNGTCNGLGSCNCNLGFVGVSCNQCGPNFYNYPTCTFCQAATTCSGNGVCTGTGTCACNVGFVGAACNQCAPNYYNYPSCTFCQSAITCSGNGTCNGLGSCNCNVGFVGVSCNQCGPDFYNYPTCTFCLASSTCNNNGTCNGLGGCNCNSGFVGAACDACAPNYYNYPTCTFCLAATTCSGNGTCNGLGGCNCNSGWSGVNCSIAATNPPLTPAPPLDRRKNRYISFVPNNGATVVAFRVAKLTVPGGSCWVQTPVQSGINQYTAKCDATPVFRVWNEPVVHVGDCEIIPVANYDVYTNAPGPVENPTALAVDTILLPVLNGKLWGDVAGINNGIEWTVPNQFTNVQDLLAIMAFISNAAVQPHFTVANLQAISSTDSCLNALVNTGDVLIAVNAIGGSSYGPPSTTKVVDPALCPVCP